MSEIVLPFRIEDFIGAYPNIGAGDRPTDDLLDAYPDFYESLYSKFEFYSLKLDATEPRPARGERYQHQEIIARFLSSHTLYDRLLLFYEMGTGKSCTAFAAIEDIKDSSSSYTGALILSRGPRIIANLMKELAYVCTTNKYMSDELLPLTEKEKSRKLKKMLSGFYSFDTFDKFTKGLQTKRDVEIVELFSNKIIVIDEVHNLRLHGRSEESRMYNQIHRLLHTAKNIKVIIMSGTPMKDSEEEIAPILNLLLPLDKQLPTGRDFVREYFDEHGTGLTRYTTVKPTKKNTLKEYMKGRVSFLKAMTTPDVVVRYAGNLIGNLKHFKVVVDQMSKFQSDVYKIAYDKDVTTSTPLEVARVNAEAASGIYSHSRQAILFVFPNGEYGKPGFDASFKKTTLHKLTKYIPDASFQALRGDTHEQTLQNIAKCSAVYAGIIRSILQNKRKLHFIYNSFVHGSGAIVLGKLLNLFGYVPANGSETTKTTRYAVLTNATVDQAQVERIIRRFNAGDNMNGDYIHIIIGSRILSEGITLKNIQEIHVATSHWNYSELAQAIARGVRLESHRDLIEDGQQAVVTIYQHVSLPAPIPSGRPSIDLQMYELCEAKDVSIKNVERLIKEAAFDCALFHKRNAAYSEGINGSRECDYQNCEYKCDGIDLTKPVVLDYSTYNLYYKQDTNVAVDITRLFKSESSYTLQQLIKLLNGGYTTFDIIYTLRKLVLGNISMKNKLGFDCYLREQHDVYFLIDRMVAGNDFFSSMYVDHPVIFENSIFDEAVNNVYLDMIREGTTATYAFDRLSTDVRMIFIQTLLELRLTGVEQTPTMQLLLDYIAPTIRQDGKAFMFEGLLFCLKPPEEGEAPLDPSPSGWQRCDVEEEEMPVDELAESLMEEDDDIGFEGKQDRFVYTGQYSNKSKKFCIKQQGEATKVARDVRTKRTGKVCSSWTKVDLLNIVVKLGIDYGNKKDIDRKDKETLIRDLTNKLDPKFFAGLSDENLRRLRYFVDLTNNDTCKKIQDFMAENYILYRADDCGVTGRKKKEE